MSVKTEESTSAVVAQALGSIGDIATLPEVTVKIIEVVEDPQGTARDLHDVIKCDPALSARVLKVVNSAFYGLPGQVASVDRAIVLLGLSAVKNIAIAASISRLFRGGQYDELLNARELWRHSVAVAVAAKKIAQAVEDVPAHDEVFLAGLIHDLGLLVARQAYPAELADVVQRCHSGEEDFLSLEASVVGATHQDFGHALATKWKFPRHVRAVVGFHHNPETLSTELQRLGFIIQCADIMCCQDGLGFALTSGSGAITEELLTGVGLTASRLTEVREQMGKELEEAEAMLSSSR
jgi:HD-like signal output (HDOD) protein